MKYLFIILVAIAACHQKQISQKVVTGQSSDTNTNKMDSLNIFFQELYRNFNERKIDLVISKMTDKVKWANGMEGGYVYGHNGVREYWIRQFKLISSKVTPLDLEEENGRVKIKVHQVVHDLSGKLLADETVYHYFHLQDDKIDLFDIGEKE